MAVAHASENVGAIFFYFLPAAATVAELAAVQFAIDEFEVNGQAGGESGQKGEQRLSGRSPAGEKRSMWLESRK